MNTYSIAVVLLQEIRASLKKKTSLGLWHVKHKYAMRHAKKMGLTTRTCKTDTREVST